MTGFIDRDRAVIMHTYSRLPVEIAAGDGVYLTDTSGKTYLDFFGGLAVNSLGYGYPSVREAVHAQVDRYMHLSNLFPQEPQIALAERLVAASGFDKVYFANSGAETMEAAFKSYNFV